MQLWLACVHVCVMASNGAAKAPPRPSACAPHAPSPGVASRGHLNPLRPRNWSLIDLILRFLFRKAAIWAQSMMFIKLIKVFFGFEELFASEATAQGHLRLRLLRRLHLQAALKHLQGSVDVDGLIRAQIPRFLTISAHAISETSRI